MGHETVMYTLLRLSCTVAATATTSVELCLKVCFCTILGSKWWGQRSFVIPSECLVVPCWWVLTRTKQLFVAATAWMKWLCACVRYWLYSRVVLCDHCFQMVYFNTTYCSLLDCSLRVKTGYCILNISLFKTDQTVLFFWKVNRKSFLMLCHDYACQVHKKREFKQKLDTFTSLIITITLTYFVVLIILLIPGF